MIFVSYNRQRPNGSWIDNTPFGVYHTTSEAHEAIKRKHNVTNPRHHNNYKYYYYNIKENGCIRRDQYISLARVTDADGLVFKL